MTRFAPQWTEVPNITSAALDDRLLRTIFPTPGVRGMQPTVVEGTMSVALAAGACVIPVAGTDETVHLATDGLGETVTLDPAPPGGQQRTDLVVVRYRPANDPAPDWVFAAKTGIPGAGGGQPPPALADNEVAIARVLVISGLAYITPSDLTDVRPPLNLGGAAPTYPARIRSGSFTFAVTGLQMIALGVVDFDPTGRIYQSQYYVAAAGIYLAFGAVNFGQGASVAIETQVRQNGAVPPAGTGRGTLWIGGSTPLNGATIPAIQLMQCAAGDQLTLWGSPGAANVPALGAFLSVAMLQAL